MSLEHGPPIRHLKPRTEAQKIRRRELWLARAGDRRALEERALTKRYDELKAAMARLGVSIGTIADLAQRHEDPVKRFEVLKARVERWEALWMVTLRKRTTRGKIVIGGAVLAELGELVMEDASDQAFLARVLALLDQRVPRVHDRVIIRGLLVGPDGGGVALSLRPGGPPDEPIHEALAALGEKAAAFDQDQPGDAEDDLWAEGETQLVEAAELDVREGGVE
jgi:hypothetical protein